MLQSEWKKGSVLVYQTSSAQPFGEFNIDLHFQKLCAMPIATGIVRSKKSALVPSPPLSKQRQCQCSAFEDKTSDLADNSVLVVSMRQNMAELWTHAGQMQLKLSLTNFLGMHRNAPKGSAKRMDTS